MGRTGAEGVPFVVRYVEFFSLFFPRADLGVWYDTIIQSCQWSEFSFPFLPVERHWFVMYCAGAGGGEVSLSRGTIGCGVISCPARRSIHLKREKKPPGYRTICASVKAPTGEKCKKKETKKKR